mmetsp:Transcript_33697/g.84032  ORF Transcript_33697/g.84032 Transcript_33697/m.84032 type:complete len:421 (-) Transcript_33697:24-1286(-)
MVLRCARPRRKLLGIVPQHADARDTVVDVSAVEEHIASLVLAGIHSWSRHALCHAERLATRAHSVVHGTPLPVRVEPPRRPEEVPALRTQQEEGGDVRRGVFGGVLVVDVHAHGHAELRLADHVGQLPRRRQLLRPHELVVEEILRPRQPGDEARLVEPDRLARAGEARGVGEDGHLAARVERQRDAARQRDRPLEQRLAPRTSRGRAVGHVDRAPVPRRGEGVGVVEAVEEDAVDHRGGCQRLNDVLDEVVPHRGVGNVPDGVPAAVGRRVAVPHAHLLARRHGVHRYTLRLEEPVGVRLGHLAARLVAWAAIARALDEGPGGCVVPIGIAEAGVYKHRQLRVLRLDHGRLGELGVDGRRPVGRADQRLPAEDGHAVLAQCGDLRSALPRGVVRAEPRGGELAPVVREGQGGGEGGRKK